MYNNFYHLNALPFENTADPRFFYDSEQHREALAAIEYTIRMRKGIVLVTGEIGSGKTTVGRMMCQRCGDQTTIVEIVPRRDNGGELLREILQSVNLPAERQEDYFVFVERLRLFLIEQWHQHKPVVLFIDEAQNLGNDAMEELRLLSNLEWSSNKLLQIVLVGQPELRQQIRQPQYDALRQRIVMAKQLRPFEPDETTQYITHRFNAASNDPRRNDLPFSPEVTQEIHRAAQGIPRLINIACDNCLLLGFVQETKQITSAMVRQVIQDMLPRYETTLIESDAQGSNSSLAEII